MLPITAAGDGLRTTLSSLLESGTDTNPALSALLADYTAYHRVLVVVGSVLLIAASAFAVLAWARVRRTRSPGRRWTFERRTWLAFALLGTGLALFLGLVVAANLSTVLDPRAGFADALGLLGRPRPGSSAAEVQHAVDTWLRSGSAAVPPEVSQAIDARLSWQRPKAIITSVLLVALIALTALVFRRLVRRSRAVRPGARDRLLLLVGAGTTAACLLLVLMVLGNTQGSLAPLSLTLFLG
ncbi:MAG: hypothetical protein AB7O74_15815 [Candidatus Nanopelagicales bacterium]